MAKTGYKEMLRDRCPIVVDWALKWCKAKTRWTEHCYRKFIWIYKAKKERDAAVRTCLGISKTGKYFEFHKTIDWENLTQEETAYWNYVESWVKWFQSNMLFVEQRYKSLIANGTNEFDIKVDLINTHLRSLLPAEDDTEDVKLSKYALTDNLVEYIINCIKDDYV